MKVKPYRTGAWLQSSEIIRYAVKGYFVSMRPTLSFFVALIIFLVCQSGRCDSPAVQVELTTQKSEISFEEYEVPVEIKITNIGTTDLQFSQLNAFTGPSIKTAGYRVHLTTNDPAFELFFHQTTSSSGPIPMITLKPEQSFSTSMVGMSIRAGRLGESVTFKVGFKRLENSAPVWSNPVTIKLKNIGDENPKGERPLQLKLEASLKSNELVETGIVHIKIMNTSGVTQSIVGPGIPATPARMGAPYSNSTSQNQFSGRWAFAPILSDNRSIFVDSGSTSCNDYFGLHDGLTLESGKSWEADCTIYYEGDVASISRPVTFRIGIVSPGQPAIWSSDLTLRTVFSVGSRKK